MSLVLGIDIGTSGVRVAACREDGEPVALESAALPHPAAQDGRIEQDPALWWAAVQRAVGAVLEAVDPQQVEAIAVDGTSGTIVAVDEAGRPVAPGRLYNDTSAAEEARRIAALAPATSGAHGASSGLAKALALLRQTAAPRILHQADWIVGQLTGRYDATDENNALKTGYDPVARRWPDWIDALPVPRDSLPTVVEPGTPLAEIRPELASAWRLPRRTMVAAGTTDGCASFLATGADRAGDAVTALGSTLTLKLLADAPLFDPKAGVYSHRLGDRWLAGGASNTGGAVLASFFTRERMAALEPTLDPDKPTGLDYYPLLQPGERFPVADPRLPPRLSPRPSDDARFFQGLLEGIARIEAAGYARLAELGGPPPRRVLSVGGGARNQAFARIRARALGAPVSRAFSEEAAIGTARLARKALEHVA